MNITKRYSDNVNYNLNIILLTKLSYFLLIILLKITAENIKARRQQHFSTSSIYKIIV